MKGLLHTFPKALGEDFFHSVPPVSIIVVGSNRAVRATYPITIGGLLLYHGAYGSYRFAHSVERVPTDREIRWEEVWSLIIPIVGSYSCQALRRNGRSSTWPPVSIDPFQIRRGNRTFNELTAQSVLLNGPVEPPLYIINVFSSTHSIR